jgi:hypothetical protein
VVGPVEQERLDECGVSGDIAGAQAGRIRALREAAEGEQPRIAVAAEGLRGEAVIRAFRDEATELLNFKVIASWRAM